jgi:hypothetical protein
MDGKSLGLLDKSKTGPKGKDDFAVAFLHILYQCTIQILIPHPHPHPFFLLYIFFLCFKGTVHRDGSG